MRCTAMSRFGVAFTSACQSPEIRLTLNVASDGSANVGRPRNVDWLRDDTVNRGRSRGCPVAGLAPSHPIETIARVNAARRGHSPRLLPLAFDSRSDRV